MGKRKRKKYNIFVIIGFFVFIVCFIYLLFSIVNEIIFINNSRKNMELYLSNKGVKYDYKYDYVGVLEIPSINLRKGFLNIDNLYNDVKWNVELLRDDNDSLVLASHNGGLYNAYFKNLDKMKFNDEIIVYDDYYVYKYIFSDSYDVMKTGYVDLFRVSDEKNIFLITCKGNDMQTVYVGELSNKYTR